MTETETKTLKLKVLKPANTKWSEFRTLINKKSFQAMRFANRLMQNEYIKRKLSFQSEEEEPIAIGSYIVKSKGSGESYKTEYKEEKGLSGYVKDAINQKVQAHFTGNKGKELLRGDSTLPTFRNTDALYIRGQRSNNSNQTGFKIFQEDKDVFAELKIRPGRPKERPKLLLATKNIREDEQQQGYWKEIKRVVDNEYRSSFCQVLRKNGDIYLAISYERPLQSNDLNPDRIMGIDIGVRSIVAAFNDSLKRKTFYVRTNNIIRRKVEIKKQRKQIKENISLRDKRRGHGKKSKFAPLRKWQEKWNNFRRTSNHEMSRAVVDYAVKNQAGIIQMEDFSTNGKDKSQTFIGNDWPLYELQEQIEYKAKEQSIETKKVNPRYTSRRCPSCGYINMYFSFDYRKQHDFPDFECEKCDTRLKDDYAAAQNNAVPDIEEQVSKQLKKQKEERKEEKEQLKAVLS